MNKTGVTCDGANTLAQITPTHGLGARLAQAVFRKQDERAAKSAKKRNFLMALYYMSQKHEETGTMVPSHRVQRAGTKP
jgi:hypothetical protein